jgi:hypothetical protein
MRSGQDRRGSAGRGGRGGGGGATANRCGAPRAKSAQPPAVPTASVTATTVGRTRRRGARPLAAEMRPAGGAVARASGTGAVAGVHRSRTTPTSGMPRSIAAAIPWPIDDSGS